MSSTCAAVDDELAVTAIHLTVDDDVDDGSGGAEQLDPRIRDKLEELNECTDNINKLEKQFEELNVLFRDTLNERTLRLRQISQKLGSSVADARPYHDCRSRVSELQKRCQTAVQSYEKSAELHDQSKETITIAEHKFAVRGQSGDTDFDHFWQEMLNQANTKFMEAKSLKTESQSEHSLCIQNYFDEQKRFIHLEKQFRSAIKKSKPYYEESANVQMELNSIKSRIETLNKVILDAKKSYAKTLKDLENISDEIHERRAQLMAKSLTREPGVGAERDDNHCEYSLKDICAEEVPQLNKSTSDTRAMTDSLSPNTSLASRSPLLGHSSSSSLNTTEDESQASTTTTDETLVHSVDGQQADGLDTNGNSCNDTNANCIEKSFVEIDLEN